MAEEKTKGFKVSEELKDKINATIKASGLEDKSWIEAVTNLWLVQEAKAILPNYSQDIVELELHTKRINELVLNMIQRSAHEQNDVQRQKSELEEENEDLVQKLGSLSKEIDTLLAERVEDQDRHEKEKEEATRLLRQMEGASENHNLLIREYQAKNDTLTGLIAEYKAGYEKSNELGTEVNKLNQLIQEMKKKLVESDNTIKVLENEHKQNIERIIERKDIERERELLKIQTEQQTKVQSLNEESTRKIQSLYERIEQLRSDHQVEILAIKEESESRIAALNQNLKGDSV
jgi:chromosome segregation ATPase